MRTGIARLFLLGALPAVAAAAPDWDPWAAGLPAPVPASDPVVAPAALFGVTAIRGYQLLLAPLLGGRCQFAPSCSRYTAACMAHDGFLPGLWRGADRISRCHGWAALGDYPGLADGRLADPPGGPR